MSCRPLLQTFKFALHCANLGLCLVAASMMLAVSAASNSSQLSTLSGLPWVVLQMAAPQSEAPACEGLGLSSFYNVLVCGDESMLGQIFTYKQVMATCPVSVPGGVDPASAQAFATYNTQMCDSVSQCSSFGKITGACSIVAAVFAIISAIGSFMRIFGTGARIASYSAILGFNCCIIAFAVFIGCANARKQFLTTAASVGGPGGGAIPGFVISLKPGGSLVLAVISFVILFYVMIMNFCLQDPSEKDQPLADHGVAGVIDADKTRPGARVAEMRESPAAQTRSPPAKPVPAPAPVPAPLPKRPPMAAPVAAPAAAPAPRAPAPSAAVPNRPQPPVGAVTSPAAPSARPPPPRPAAPGPPPPERGNFEMSNPLKAAPPPAPRGPNKFTPPGR